MKFFLNKRGQSIVEYVVIMVVILAAIFGSGIIDRVRAAFSGYADSAIGRMR